MHRFPRPDWRRRHDQFIKMSPNSRKHISSLSSLWLELCTCRSNLEARSIIDPPFFTVDQGIQLNSPLESFPWETAPASGRRQEGHVFGWPTGPASPTGSFWKTGYQLTRNFWALTGAVFNTFWHTGTKLWRVSLFLFENEAKRKKEKKIGDSAISTDHELFDPDSVGLWKLLLIFDALILALESASESFRVNSGVWATQGTAFCNVVF